MFYIHQKLFFGNAYIIQNTSTIISIYQYISYI